MDLELGALQVEATLKFFCAIFHSQEQLPALHTSQGAVSIRSGLNRQCCYCWISMSPVAAAIECTQIPCKTGHFCKYQVEPVKTLPVIHGT